MLIRLSYTPLLIAKTKQKSSKIIVAQVMMTMSLLINVLVVCCISTFCHIKDNESNHNLV